MQARKETPGDLSERLARLSPQQRESLLQRLANSRSRPQVPRMLPRRHGARYLPLSFAQQRLWFLHQLEPASSAYNTTAALLLRGVLRVEWLAWSLAQVVRRHESLRTIFVTRQDGPAQVILSELGLELPVVDLALMPEAAREGEAQRWVREAAEGPFDLRQAPLWRAGLLRLGPEEHLFQLTLHHIVCDGWSAGVLIREVEALYRSRMDGAAPILPDLPIQYADFASWQREWLQGPVLEAQLGYWRTQLGCAEPNLPLPYDHPRPAGGDSRGSSRPIIVPHDLLQALRRIAQTEGATLFTVLLTAFKALLFRYTGQEDLSVGVPIANRKWPEIENLIGFFANTLVMRTVLSPDLGFDKALGRVLETNLQAHAHQDLPFEKLVEELAPAREAGRTPLFEVMFSFQNAPRPTVRLAGLVVELLDVANRQAKFDLLLDFWDAPEGFSGRCEYRADLFEASTMARFVGHFETLVAGIAAEPRQRLADLPLLAAGELHQILREWNGARDSAERPSRVLSEIFEEQAARHASREAVSFAGERVSYRELDRRANRLARYLRSLGVGPEVLVGLFLERSLDLVIAILGVLKAGGAYVPLEVVYPRERRAFVQEDAGLRIVLTQSRLLEDLPDTGVLPLCLDGLDEELAGWPEEAVRGGAEPDNLAYVIYTSGSTGRPKGVRVTHANVVRLFSTTEPWFGFGAGDVWTLFHSHAFDFSVWELWGALLYGGRLVVVPYWLSRSPEELLGLLSREGVTVLNQTPSAFRQLMWTEEASPSPGLRLRWVIFGGEALEIQSLRPWWERHGDESPRLVNMYGITETTVHVTFRPLGLEDLESRGSLIGVPMPDLEVHVLDRAQRPVPLGVPGELCVGGAGLCRGYLGRPELDAERLIPHPFSSLPGERLYRSGDLGRRVQGGELEYLGRIDHQVKIRGFRIEIGEIEMTLDAHPGVGESVVVLRELSADDKRLVAYVVPDPQRALAAHQQLRLRREGRLEGVSIHELPNGMAVAHLNRSETEFLFDEIFRHRSYLRHGIRLSPGARVVDVGANIGLFSLFCASLADGVEVLAFEPIPEAFDALRLNIELFGLRASPFNVGLAEQERMVEFTYYPHVSVLSGYHSDPEEEREVVRAFLTSQHPELGAAQLEELLSERLSTRRVRRPLRRLSDVLREQGVDRIDLLKVDVEKSELEVLEGIDEEHWPWIRQVVVEVHDADGRLAQVEALLGRHGFSLHREQDESLRATALYNVFAVRGDAADTGAPAGEDPSGRALDAWRSPRAWIESVRELSRRKLPEYMVPSGWVALDQLPLTPNGKVDRRALPAPEEERSEGGAAAPRNPFEEILALLWAQVLGLERVGVHDSFFDQGGHSLLATRVISRIREAFGVELRVRDLFEAPTVAGLAERIRQAMEEARALLPPIEPVRRDADLPLSFAQQRLWFLDQLDPGSPHYNIPAALRVGGPLDAPALALCLGEIVRRHEALRTVFAAPEGSPVQRIRPASPVALPIVDLSDLPDGDREATALRLAGEEAGRPFDLTRGPLLRSLLLRMTEGVHIVLLTMHHIASDGWSMGVLIGEITALYPALTRDLPSPLPELPVQYADFAVWQRSWLHGEILDAQLDHWRRRLAGAPTVLELPLDRPRPAVQTFRGAIRPLHLEQGLSDAVRELCRREKVTPFMALLAAWAVLLGRHAGQDDVLVGAPVAGRDRREIEGLIGFFVNTLVLRSDLSGHPSFIGLLDRVRRTALDAFTHQDLPFERIVEEVVVERNRAVSPLFQVLFALQNAPRQDLQVPGLEVSRLDVDTGLTKFDLTLTLQESLAGFEGTLEHNSDLFDGSTAERLLSRFTALLQAAVEDPSLAVADLPILLPRERQQSIVEWNDTRFPFLPACLHELVEAQVDRTPDAVAVIAGNECLTYGELDRRANRVAHHLRSLGVGPDVLVGLCAERSPQMVIGMLGILKAGGAYVPIDPEYPRERLAFLLEDSGMRVLLTQQGLAGRLPSGELDIVFLDGEERTGGVSDRRPAGGALPENLAYVIYTSGSTGRPKGVLVPHGGVVNRLSWAQRAYPVTAADRVLHKASFSFDFSVWECFGPLVAGAQLILARPGEQRDPALLVRTIQERRITLVHFIPSMLQAFVAEEGAEACTSLRYIFSGGEALSLELQERCLSRLPAVLRNQYGPTEISIDTTDWICRPEDSRRGFVPLGFPIANTALYVLDERLSPVPPGVAGELCVGGAGLARGYGGRPDLTAERFIPDPFSGSFGARLYRTGDRALRLPDGNVRFLGRIDHQVKVRGFRIELGEIEVALASHPSVRDCVLSVREDAPGSRLLVAYVVLHPEADLPDSSDLKRNLRGYLEERLPGFMVPSAIVILDALPLLPNGKVDRRTLPAPEWSAAVSSAAPRAPVEEVLAGVFAEILGLEGVGVEDDFFGLGGHSLLATRLVSRLREIFGRELPLRLVFESPTVAGLAARIGSLREGPAAPPVRPVSRDRELPLSFAQQRLWFLDQIEPGRAAYNIPLVLRLTGKIGLGLLERIFSEIVRRHEALRTTFESRAGWSVQVIASPAPLGLPLVDVSGLPGSEREREARALAASEARRPFDLQRGPLLRLLLVRLAEADHLLLLCLHHIVSDGWSLGVLLREITALHEAFSQGLPSPFAELPVQYADFAVWQRSWLVGEILDTQLAYWKGRLAGAPAVLELPLDRPRPLVQSYRGAIRPLHLGPGLSDAVRKLGRREGATSFMVLLAAWALLLARHAGQDDVLVGAPIAGRNRREIEGLIGFFVNTLVLRSDLSGNPTFAELLGRVRRTALDAFTHQDLPFERLVEDLAPERSLAHTPLFQVLFMLQNAPTGNLILPGLALSPMDVETGVAKFDLSLFLGDAGDGLSGALEFATDLFDAATVERLWNRFRALLESALVDPRRHLAELALMPAGELHQILWEWNDVPGRNGSACVHCLVEAQARQTPEAAAVLTADGQEISYRELDRLAEGLALRLRELGVRPDDRVGVFLERSWEGVVALLAILKAGGCYLPLDPAYPYERLRFMLSDAAARVIVTRVGLAAALPSQGVRVLPLDDFRDDGWPEEGRRADLPAVGLDHLAYVIYTSGSTGWPKGVALPHRTLANLIDWQIAASAAPAGRTLQFASPSFDVSLQETLATWAAGGTLVLLSEEDRRDAEALLGRLCEARVERLFLPFVALQQIAEAASRAAGLPPLREVVTAGEQLQVTPEVRALFSRLPGCVLRNQYGPSETHVVTEASLWNERGEVEEWPALPSIGRPLAGIEVHLLDPRGVPVPSGVPGEIHLGGMGLARGYLGRPDLTADRFVPDPWGRGSRLYRTGDLARRRPSGEIEFLGRIDHQVKIRGFRIELGEIEAALAAHPAVREAVVVVQGKGAAKRLVACVVPAQGLSQLADTLRADLRERLPDYMVPGTFVAVESFPLTPSGKVDRRALSLSSLEPRQTVSAGAPPRNPAEELLAGIWGEVLGIERVEVHESFFALGGHSLLATQVTSRIRGVFGVELPVRQLFESPTISELARAVQQAGSPVQAPPILPVPRNRESPVSFAQQRLWFIDQIEPGNPAYNIPLALRLNGKIEPRLLERIFSEIIRRHEALRTTFTSREDGPAQVTASLEPVELPFLDLSHLPEDEREAEARALALSEARRPFDLQRGPLLRLLLVRLAEMDCLLLLTLHHIVSDGWSLGVLVREVTALYEALSQDAPSPLADLPVQYADFAVWQRSWLQGEVLDAQLGHWRQRLAGAPAVLELPLDRPRPMVQSYRGARCPVVLSSPLSAAIGRLCRQQGVTPFMALLAGWAVLLGRHSGEDDVLVGAPIAGRNRREIESLIGFFVNTLVLRSDLSGNPSLAELLGQVRRTSLDAFSHQDLPFERLVEDLAPERSLAHTPMFQVMLMLQNAPIGDLAVPGLTLSPVDMETGLAKFDLSLSLFESQEGFAGALTYAADLFDRSTAERLIARFQTLLSGMAAADPATPLLDLAVLSEAERQQLLVDWSAEDGRVSTLSLHGLIERQVGRTPDAVAVIFEEERWSYRDLLRRSRGIAASLRRQGVGPGDRVAILDQRSAERVARVLGVLASGATYVAIDSGQPRAWRARILADSAPAWILPPRPPVVLEEGELEAGAILEDPEPSSGDSESRLPAIEGDLPGYVVYTSGSTGRPKGIVAHHRGAATYLEWVIRKYGLSESDVALQLAPLTFDASLRDTFAPLAAGGRIVIVPDGVARDPAALLERMEAHGVTCLPSIVPSLLRLLVEEKLASGREVPALRLILASGEKLHGADAAAVRRALGERVVLINQYGPSEATMTSTWYPVTADDESLPALPVGRPAASARVFLLDRTLRPVPPGAAGEICLGGPGLAFGYLGQPDRTAEAFVPDPFGAPGGRLYRTGDRGRYRTDGVLELLGRIDLQVKIRGQRVEPGEVEAALRSHPAVREVVVAAFGEDEPRLAAWLVAEGLEAADLRAFLDERLPASMIPADWAFLDALPLTPHGKVDRARLPEPGRAHRAVQAPRDRTELRLVRLWEDVLSSQPVGVRDNFFALGGHSLSAVRLMAGVRRLFGRELPLSELFRRPTIEALAELLRRGERDLPWSPLVALTPGRTEKTPLFCVHGADGQVLTFGDLARALSAAGEDRPVFALEARGLSDGQVPMRSIEEMAALYLAAIREVRPRGPYRLLGYSMGSKIAFAMARQLERDDEAVEQLVLVDIPAFPRAAANPDLEIPEEIRVLPDFDPELAGRHIAVWTANQEASHRWFPAPYRGRALLIVAEDGVCAGAADPTLGWGSVIGGGVEVVSTPGDHFSLFRPPHVQTLAERIRIGG